MLLSRTVSWSIAAVLLVAASLGRIAGADNTAASEGVFRHLRALQDIASTSNGNRAAGTPGYDRSAEYVAERLKEAGYVVRLEEFEFPFFEERAPPVLVTSTHGGAQTPASAGGVRTLGSRNPDESTAEAQGQIPVSLFSRWRSLINTSSAVITSPNCWMTFSRALRCSSSDSAAQQSSTSTTLKSSIMASRAVDSQHTFVLVPATSTVSMPVPRSTRSSVDEPGMNAL